MNPNTMPTTALNLDYRPPRPWLRWFAVLLAFCGWWLSFDLAKLSFGNKATTPWLENTCGGNAVPEGAFDCRSVLSSSRAYIPISQEPGGTRIPVAVFGMGYFAFVGLWYLFVGPTTRSRWARHMLIMAVVFFGALFSAEMMLIMQHELHKWCSGCIATHAINGLLAVVTILAFPWRRDAENRAPHPRGRLALATLAACAFLFLLHLSVALFIITQRVNQHAVKEYMAIVDDPDYARWDYNRQPIESVLAGLPVDDGPADAPNHVVAFIDYQCPACKQTHETLAALLRKYPGKISITYKHFPLDKTCNADIRNGIHPVACAASRAVEAARAIGGVESFLAMGDLCYERIRELEDADYVGWAEFLGIDPAKFAAACNSTEVDQRIAADIALAHQLGVTEIPILYLNGRRFKHSRSAEAWEHLLIGVEAAPDSQPVPSDTRDDLADSHEPV